MTYFDPEMPDFNPEPPDEDLLPFPVEADIVYAYECRVVRTAGAWACSHGHGAESTWEAAVKVCLDHEPEEVAT